MKYILKIITLLIVLHGLTPNVASQTTLREDPEVRAYFNRDSSSFTISDCRSPATRKTAAACKVLTATVSLAGSELFLLYKESYTLNDRWNTSRLIAPLDQINFWDATIKSVDYMDETMQPKKYYNLMLVTKDKKLVIRSDYNSSILGKESSATAHIYLPFYTESQAEKVKNYLKEEAQKEKVRKEQLDKEQSEIAAAESAKKRQQDKDEIERKMDESYLNMAKAGVEYAKSHGTYKPSVSTTVRISVLEMSKLVNNKDLKGLLALSKSAGITGFNKKSSVASPYSSLARKDSVTIYESNEKITIAEGIYAPLKIQQFGDGKIEVFYPFHWFEMDSTKKEITDAGFVNAFAGTYSNGDRKLWVIIPNSTHYTFPYITIYSE